MSGGVAVVGKVGAIDLAVTSLRQYGNVLVAGWSLRLLKRAETHVLLVKSLHPQADTTFCQEVIDAIVPKGAEGPAYADKKKGLLGSVLDNDPLVWTWRVP